MFALSYVGLATAIGHSLDIPPIIRSLARHYEDIAMSGTDFIMDEKMVQYLTSGIFTVPDSHIRDFACDWWTESKAPKTNSNILSGKTIEFCLEFHAKEHNRALDLEKAGGPPVAPAPPNPTHVQKPSYGWHSKTWDDSTGNHCVYCRSYRAVPLGVMDQFRDLRNMVNALEVVHQSERNMAMRDAACLNDLYEESVINDCNKSAGQNAKLVPPSKKAATSKKAKGAAAAEMEAAAAQMEAARAEMEAAKKGAAAWNETDDPVTQYPPISKWLSGFNLTEEHIKSIVRAVDNDYKLPHSGYDDTLNGNSLPTESAGRSRSEYDRLDEEAQNPPNFEALSSDIWVERALHDHEIPIAFNTYPLLRASGGNWVRTTPRIKVANGNDIGNDYLWLNNQPDEYVQRPLPPLDTMIPFPLFNIGNDLDAPIYIGSDDDEVFDALGGGPSGAGKDAYLLTGDSPPLYIGSDDEIVGAADIYAAAAPKSESDGASADAMEIDAPANDIFIPSDDNSSEGGLSEEIYIPDEDTFMPDADIFIPDEDEDEYEIAGPSGTQNSGPYTAAHFVNFDLNLID
jgi:hypothetical protein